MNPGHREEQDGELMKQHGGGMKKSGQNGPRGFEEQNGGQQTEDRGNVRIRVASETPPGCREGEQQSPREREGGRGAQPQISIQQDRASAGENPVCRLQNVKGAGFDPAEPDEAIEPGPPCRVPQVVGVNQGGGGKPLLDIDREGHAVPIEIPGGKA